MSVGVNARMATAIDRYETIALLEQINGIPIAEIEKRARPGQYAKSGFMGPTESFKDVLQKDWRTVQALGTTHIELAAHLKEIWNKVRSGSEETRNFSYRVNLLPNSSLQECDRSAQGNNHLSKKIIFALGIIAGVGAIIGAFTISHLFLLALLPATGCIAYASGKNEPIVGQILRGKIQAYKRIQEDLFAQNENQAYAWGWNSELCLINPFNNLSVTVGQGVIDYIERYGFYEGGGDQNLYRVDPLKLVAILTGAPPSPLQ